jgi:hypothetical protein
MKTCTKCGHSNKDAAKFCGACGSKIELPSTAEPRPAETLCPVCGSKNRPGVHFCGYCGANLSQAAEGATAVPPPSGATLVDAEGPAEPSAGQPIAVEAVEPAPTVLAPGDGVPVEASPTTVSEPIAAAATASSESKPVATCGHCGTMIRYCPCCGEPLLEADLSTTGA